MKTITLFRTWYTHLHQSGWFNKYTLTLSVFVVWMLFFDEHNAVVQYRLSQTVSNLEEQIAADEELLQAALEERNEISTNSEKYAR